MILFELEIKFTVLPFSTLTSLVRFEIKEMVGIFPVIPNNTNLAWLSGSLKSDVFRNYKFLEIQFRGLILSKYLGFKYFFILYFVMNFLKKFVRLLNAIL